MKILPPREDQPRVAAWMFMLTWLFGGVALIIGFEGGTVAETCAIVIFCFVCALWLWAVKLSRGKGDGGLVVVAFWLLSLAIAALSDFHRYLKDVFFWIATAMTCCLIAAFFMLQRRSKLRHGDGVV